MSEIKSQPTTLTPAERYGKSGYEKKGYRYRTSYTPTAAEKWRGVFDDMIVTHKDQVVLSTVTGLRPNTMYAGCQDALKWLADNIPLGEGEVVNKYGALRTQISVTRTTEGIELYFKGVTNIRNVAVTNSGPTAQTITFKEEFTAWLTLAQPGDIFERNAVLSADQRKWLVDVMGGIEGAEMDLEGGKVKVMR